MPDAERLTAGRIEAMEARVYSAPDPNQLAGVRMDVRDLLTECRALLATVRALEVEVGRWQQMARDAMTTYDREWLDGAGEGNYTPGSYDNAPIAAIRVALATQPAAATTEAPARD